MYYDQDAPRLCGIAPGEVDHLDVGFWVRRFEDGTAGILGTFIRKVLAAYDREWLATLDGEATPPVFSKAYVDDQEVKFVRLQPMLYGGNQYVVRDGEGEKVLPEGVAVRFDPPEPRPELPKDSADRLIHTNNRFSQLWFLPASGIGDVPDASQTPAPSTLIGLGQTHVRLDPDTLQVLAETPVGREGEVPNTRRLSGNGQFLVVGLRSNQGNVRDTLILDAATGRELERLPGFQSAGSLAVNHDATILAGCRGGQEIEVRFRGDPPRQPLHLKTSGPLVLHPTLPILIAGSRVTQVWDLSTGTMVGSVRPDEYAQDRAFDPSGRLLWTGAAQRGVVEAFEPSTHALTFMKEIKGEYPGARWIPGPAPRLLVSDAGRTRVWDVNSGKILGRSVLANGINGISPDGRRAYLNARASTETLIWALP